MDVFKDQWEKQVRILTEAVDDITSVDDFLSVSGMELGKIRKYCTMLYSVKRKCFLTLKLVATEPPPNRGGWWEDL